MEKKEETNNNKEERNNEGKEEDRVPQMALNHVSRLCRDVKESIDFYSKVLGLVLIERPPAFEFDGAWLFNYGVGVHLIQAKDEDSLPKTDRVLDPRDNHISFQVILNLLDNINILIYKKLKKKTKIKVAISPSWPSATANIYIWNGRKM